jgi:hypothetical protein
MKLKNLLIASAVMSMCAGIYSCKKENSASTNSSSSSEIASTVEISTDNAISDNLNADAENILTQASVDNNVAGSTPTGVTSPMGNLPACATVTVTPAQGFPKTITIDFGTGCASGTGIIRSGIITITLSDSLRKSGSVATMIFNNYYVGGYKKQGNITWINTKQDTTNSWTRVCYDTITSPLGKTWTHTGTHAIVEISGNSTPRNIIDNVYLTTGSSTTTNANGVTRTATILTPLEKKVSCDNIDSGTVKIQGPNHYAIIDYGDGTCDRLATLSIDGGTPVTILLR